MFCLKIKLEKLIKFGGVTNVQYITLDVLGQVHGRMDQKVARKNILYSSFGSVLLHYVIAWHNAEGYDSYKS
jgi:hypothetical protein